MGFSIIIVTTLNIVVNMGVIVVLGIKSFIVKWPMVKKKAIILFNKIRDKLRNRNKVKKEGTYKL
jgi:hypothetical protein